MKPETTVMLIFTIFSLMVFMVALHNNDNAFNLHTFNEFVDEKIVEHNVYGNEVDEYTLHARSLNMLFVSYMALFSLTLALIINNEVHSNSDRGMRSHKKKRLVEAVKNALRDD